MTDTEASAKGVQPIEKVLLWIVLAFRVLGYFWLVLLVGAALATDDGADESIIITMVVGAGLWTVLTVVLSRTPGRIKRPWFVVADGVAHAPWVPLHAGGSYTTLARAILDAGGRGQVVNIVPTLLATASLPSPEGLEGVDMVIANLPFALVGGIVILVINQLGGGHSMWALRKKCLGGCLKQIATMVRASAMRLPVRR